MKNFIMHASNQSHARTTRKGERLCSTGRRTMRLFLFQICVRIIPVGQEGGKKRTRAFLRVVRSVRLMTPFFFFCCLEEKKLSTHNRNV